MPKARVSLMRPISSVMWHIFAGLGAMLLAASAQAQDNVTLKVGAGREIVEGYCNACHSLDYLVMNARFLNRQGWQTEVNKMITSYGAPIKPGDAKIIVDYLVANYGIGD
jgi:mono/diheme cytochrome c family protein